MNNTISLKKNFCIFFLFLTLVIPLSAKTYLSTPRRCGTHYFLYSLEYLTKHRWKVQKKQDWNWFDLGSDPENERFIHCHNLYRYQDYDSSEDKLILLIRNYREGILRDTKSFEEALNSIHPSYCYFANLNLYDKWTPENRLLITYEELLLHPKQTFEKVLQFLQLPSFYLDEYLNDLDSHKKKVMRFYRRLGGSQSKGENFNFHSEKLTLDEIEQFDSKVETTFPYLFANYLKHYKEQKNTDATATNSNHSLHPQNPLLRAHPHLPPPRPQNSKPSASPTTTSPPNSKSTRKQ